MLITLHRNLRNEVDMNPADISLLEPGLTGEGSIITMSGNHNHGIHVQESQEDIRRMIAARDYADHADAQLTTAEPSGSDMVLMHLMVALNGLFPQMIGKLERVADGLDRLAGPTVEDEVPMVMVVDGEEPEPRTYTAKELERYHLMRELERIAGAMERLVPDKGYMNPSQGVLQYIGDDLARVIAESSGKY